MHRIRNGLNAHTKVFSLALMIEVQILSKVVRGPIRRNDPCRKDRESYPGLGFLFVYPLHLSQTFADQSTILF